MENLILALVPKTQPTLLTRYGIAAALVLVAFLIRLSLDAHLRGYPFLLFFPVIFIVSLIYDRGSGILATILSTILVIAFLVEPSAEEWLEETGNLLALLLFLGIGTGIAILTEALRLALEKVAQAEREKDLLLSELNHRIRNDLQTLTGLLHIELTNTHPMLHDQLKAAADRVNVLARVYARLTRRDGHATVNARDFFEGLIEDLRLSMVADRPVGVGQRIEDAELSLQCSLALGLVLNELITNALKHAFPNGRAGRVDVSFERQNSGFLLRVADDGGGAPPNWQEKETSLGLRLVRQLAQQLQSEPEIINHGGFSVTVRVPSSCIVSRAVEGREYGEAGAGAPEAAGSS